MNSSTIIISSIFQLKRKLKIAKQLALMHPYKWFITSAIIVTLLHGCGSVVVGGAVVGVSMVHDRRTTATVAADEKIELVATATFNEDEALNSYAKVRFISYNRTVLIIGQANSTRIKTRIAELVHRIPEVSRVVDQVTVASPSSFEQLNADIRLTSKVKLALLDLGISDFDSTRVKVVTEQGDVYLLGLLTSKEAAIVMDKVRYVSGAQRVISLFEYISL